MPATQVVLPALGDRGRRRSEATVVEASVVARLLGMRLLKLDATIVLHPAEISPVPPQRPGEPRARSHAGRVLPAPGARGLSDAVRSIDEGAALLAEARRRH
jgi:hypothetical protein